MQLLWAWDALDASYTDANGVHNLIDRPAVLGETCTQGQSGCPPFFLAPSANDWLHGNTLQLTTDGNILISLRHQDWVMKLNYANGAGDGHIMWRFGLDGDFTLTTVGTKGSADLGYPWFSHQHEAEIALGGKLFNGSEIFTVFDNGNTRLKVFNDMAHSRGQAYAVNEADPDRQPELEFGSRVVFLRTRDCGDITQRQFPLLQWMDWRARWPELHSGCRDRQ